MRFIKENFHDIVKLFINQLGVTIFSFFLYTATSVGMKENDSLKTGVNIGVSVLSILFFCFLLYTVAWDWGAKDKIRIDGGRLKEFKYKGALLSLYANVINFFIAAVAFVTVLIFMLTYSEASLFDPSLTLTIDKVTPNFALELHSVFNILMRFISSLYNGLLRGIFSGMSNAFLSSLYESVGFFILPVIAIFATHFGYVMGLREKKIFSSNAKSKK